MLSTSSGQLSVKHSKTGKRTILMISFLALLKTTFCQTLIQNDAGEARGPSRKMRLEQLVRNSAGIHKEPLPGFELTRISQFRLFYPLGQNSPQILVNLRVHRNIWKLYEQ